MNYTMCSTMMIPLTVLLLSTCLGKSTESPIAPDTVETHATEGENVQLSCRYNGTDYSLHWYRQFSQSVPEFLILDYEGFITNATPPVPGISIKHNKTARQVFLEMSSAKVSDVAVYYCAMQPTVTGNPVALNKKPHSQDAWEQHKNNIRIPELKSERLAKRRSSAAECRAKDSVDQLGGFITATEGASVTLPCNYTRISTGLLAPYLFWYQQKPNGLPVFMLRRSASTADHDEGFKRRFVASLTSNSAPLIILNLQVSDSAVYYCAPRPTVTEDPIAPYKKPTQCAEEKRTLLTSYQRLRLHQKEEP
ncbi:uncharacterized protein LOC134099448 [Sardina pilchardus]|uniref:uncharacterized protein LOC134099448 n=1 Tax=Sardina pilchardus TaxID=27697 RepID=UPI002E161CF1